MSRRSFRPRALGITEQVPLYDIEEIPVSFQSAAINREVSTGMEKEEEKEHHLQKAIFAQQAYGRADAFAIPTPEIYEVPKEFLQKLCPTTFKCAEQLIDVQPFCMDQDIPDYDMDSEDENWLNIQKVVRNRDITFLRLEQMMDRLEKTSLEQDVMYEDVKLLLGAYDEKLCHSFYNHWLDKRLRKAHSLIPLVKTEARDELTNDNPYVAFRRRVQKMQMRRKNRKKNESCYEKTLKLKRDLVGACSLLEMLRKRDKLEREYRDLRMQLFHERCQVGHYDIRLLSELLAMKLDQPLVIPVQNPLVPNPETKSTRNKNWMNDETSFEKMLKLKRDLVGVRSVVEMGQRTDEVQREYHDLSMEIFDERYQVGDFSDQLQFEMIAMTFSPHLVTPVPNLLVTKKPEAKFPRNKKKRTYKKRSMSENANSQLSAHETELGYEDIESSGDNGFSLNEKTNETCYEKMLKLKSDMGRALSLLQMVQEREKMKREYLDLSMKIFDIRCQIGDSSGQLQSEVMAMKFPQPSVTHVQKPLVTMKPEAKLPCNEIGSKKVEATGGFKESSEVFISAEVQQKNDTSEVINTRKEGENSGHTTNSKEHEPRKEIKRTKPLEKEANNSESNKEMLTREPIPKNFLIKSRDPVRDREKEANDKPSGNTVSKSTQTEWLCPF